MGFVLVMTKGVDLQSASGHTPPRLSICSELLGRSSANAWGSRRDPSPGWARCAKRIGLAPLSLVLFCSLFKGKRRGGRGGGEEKGGKKCSVTKRGEKGRVGVARNVMGEGGMGDG